MWSGLVVRKVRGKFIRVEWAEFRRKLSRETLEISILQRMDFLKFHVITEYFQNGPWRPQLPPN